VWDSPCHLRLTTIQTGVQRCLAVLGVIFKVSFNVLIAVSYSSWVSGGSFDFFDAFPRIGGMVEDEVSRGLLAVDAPTLLGKFKFLENVENLRNPTKIAGFEICCP
jgi:hypothetical protein